MLKPHVLHLPTRPALTRRGLSTTAAALSDGGAARFARAVLDRLGGGGEEVYPEAWLVLREAEEREAVQAQSDVHLTQLTLRLALQLSEYLTLTPDRRESRSMEPGVLRQTLNHCLTALETRDRETCREVRELLRQTEQIRREETVRSEGAERVRQTLERRLRESLERERVLVLEREQTVQAVERTLFREGAAPSHPAASPGRPADQAVSGRADGDDFTKASSPGPAPVGERTEALPGRERALARLERLAALRSAAQAARSPAGGPRRTENRPSLPRFRQSADIRQTAPAMTIRLFRAGGPEVGPLSPVQAGEAAEDQGELRLQKERFLQILARADREERERVWTLVEEQSELALRHQSRPEGEEALDGGEKLAQLVRESTRQEYRTLLRVLERGLNRPEPPQAAVPAPVPAPSAAERREEPAPSPATEAERLAAQAAPVVEWLAGALETGAVRREELLERLQRAPQEVQTAFWALARESGAFPRARQARAEAAPAARRLSVLLKESRRRELTQLVRWAQERRPAAQEATAAAEKPETEPAAEGAREPGAGPERQPAPERERTTAIREERRALSELRTFLTEQRTLRRTELRQLLTTAGPEERLALLAAMSPAEAQIPTVWTAREEERLVHLIERSDDPAAVVGQALSAEPVRALELRMERERTVLDRLTAYVQGRGGQWQGEWEKLLAGLSEGESQILLRRLAESGAVRSAPEGERATEAPALERAERLLTFQTQKEYKSFRYRLNEYLRTVELPARPVTAALTRWVEKSRRAEGEEIARRTAPLLEQRPAAWAQSLLGTASEGGAPAAAQVLQALARGDELVYARLIRAAERQERPPGLLAASLPKLAAETSRAVEVRPTTGAPGLLESAPQQNAQQTAAARLMAPRVPGTFQASPEKAREIPGYAPAGLSHRERERILVERPGELVERVSAQMTGQPMAQPFAAAAAASPATPQMPGAFQAFPEGARGVPGYMPAGLSHRERERILMKRTVSAVQTRFLREIATQPAVGRAEWLSHLRTLREIAGTARQRLSPARGLTVPGLPGAEEREELPFPEGPELALRKEGPGRAAVRETARRSAERSAEQVIRRQAPELQLLRRQDQVRAQAVEEQKRDIQQLREQMERQEKLVRQAMERTLPEGQRQGQVRDLARAVMKEMEQQLRLERQRRGLF